MNVFFKIKPVLQKLSAFYNKPQEAHTRGTILDSLIQRKIAAKRPKIELSGVIIDRNRWALLTLILAGMLFFTLLTLLIQINRFEKNMRILMVKLAPDGTHTEEFVKNRTMPAYFLNTLNTLMTQYVERRYSKIPDSITADYGFAYQFMSPQLQSQFMNEYQAVQKARDFQTCTNCNSLQINVTAIQHYESDNVVIHAKPDKEYRSTVFVTIVQRNPDGTLLDKEKQIITLVWRIRSLAELNKNIGALEADPIGLEILRASVRKNPQQ